MKIVTKYQSSLVRGVYKREDFWVGVAGLVGNVSAHVLSFGPHATNSEWTLFHRSNYANTG